MGDLQYWLILKSMSECSQPLLRIEGTNAPFPSYVGPSPDFRNGRVVLTDTGRRILEGKEDRIALSGIDCWLGGVHLQGKENVWRWDELGETLVEPP